EGGLHLCASACVPVCDIVLGDGLGCEGRVRSRGRQGAMQLRGAPSEGADQGEIQAVNVIGKRSSRAPVLEEADEIDDRVVPAVALVHDKGLQQREGRYAAIVAAMLHR